jgi:hypothetical protein
VAESPESAFERSDSHQGVWGRLKLLLVREDESASSLFQLLFRDVAPCVSGHNWQQGHDQASRNGCARGNVETVLAYCTGIHAFGCMLMMVDSHCMIAQ